MKVVAISDTHTYHRSCTPPDGDILIHAGDFTIYGEPDEVLIFNQWLGELPHKYKIVIAGNHDLGFEREPERFRKMITNAVYLQDGEITIEGLRIYGAPWTPKYGDWAFMPPRDSIELKDKWAKIPNDLDILVTHGPPYGVCDLIEGYSGRQKWRENVGCALLRDAILAKKPRFAICGHVHYSNGSKWLGDTKVINAAICDESYAPVQPAQVFDIEPINMGRLYVEGEYNPHHDDFHSCKCHPYI